MSLFFKYFLPAFLLLIFCGLKNTTLSDDNRPENAAEETMVTMRDGVKLQTTIWKPAEKGTYPVVLERGYWAGIKSHAQAFTKAGYIYVGQKTRGDKTGNMFFPDAKDGYDCLEWISGQSWCDGNIAMYGKSFMAATQWLAAAEQHPNLKAIIPQNVNPEGWICGYRCYGALTLAMTSRGRFDTDTYAEKYGWLKLWRHLPLVTMDNIADKQSQIWDDYVLHSSYDDFWKAISIRDKYHKIKIPVYLMCGWYDYYPRAALRYFNKLKNLGASNEIRVTIDATSHLNTVVGDRNMGKEAAKNELQLAIRWLDFVLKGIDNGTKDEPKIKIFVMGINEWRYENEWPTARAEFTKYYFHSNGTRTGSLSTTEPADEPPNVYIYNPENPVPTLGGNHSWWQTDTPEIIRVGPVDQRSNEDRDDVLIFTTPQLKQDTEVTGPVEVKLYAASSARDTDFIAKLIDVYPDGTAFNLTEGIIRARFREDIWGQPKLLIPGKIYEYTIVLQPTSNVFKKGHCIRVHLTSSNFPLWDRNPNTGHKQGMDDEMLSAEQTIYHNKKYHSHIILPVIKNE